LQARFYFDAGSRARRRGSFLCSAKEKNPKERRPEDLPAIAGSLRFSRKPALAQLATLKQAQASSGFHCDARLRLREDNSKPQATIYVGRVKRSVPVGFKFYPSRSTHRVPEPIRGIGAHLFERSSGARSRVVRTPRIGEERTGKAAKRPCIFKPVSALGALLFGYFLLGTQEKVPRRRAREPASKSIAPARRSYRRNKKNPSRLRSAPTVVKQ
jgi:hypothetical protein